MAPQKPCHCRSHNCSGRRVDAHIFRAHHLDDRRLADDHHQQVETRLDAALECQYTALSETLSQVRIEGKDPVLLTAMGAPPAPRPTQHSLSRALQQVATTNRVLQRLEDLVALISNDLGDAKKERLLEWETNAGSMEVELRICERWKRPEVKELCLQARRVLTRCHTLIDAHRQTLTLMEEEKRRNMDGPGAHDTSHHYNGPLERTHPVIQLVVFMIVACNVVLRLPRRGCNWLFGMSYYICQTAMLFALSMTELPAFIRRMMSIFPRDLDTAKQQFNLGGKETIYAVCTKCHATYKPDPDKPLAPYPVRCNSKRNQGHARGGACDTILTRGKKLGSDTVYVPIRPFVSFDLKDWLGGMLSRQGYEDMMDAAWTRTGEKLSPDELVDIFHGSVLKEFKGPDGKTHFSLGGDEGRYVFALGFDFFNPLTNKIAGKRKSVGVLTLTCLNLPLEIRYKPENMFLAGIIPGPREPPLVVNSYLTPLIDQFLEFWNTGVFYSRTFKFEMGRRVICALIAVICDLPAARKLGGFAACTAKVFCTRCCCRTDKEGLNNFDIENWQERTNEDWRESARQYKEMAEFNHNRAEGFLATTGTRWSELLRLPYFDPSRFIVVDSMHNLFLGLLKDHFRTVFGYRVEHTEGGEKDDLEEPLVYSIAIEPSADNPSPQGKKPEDDVRKIIDKLQHPMAVSLQDNITFFETVQKFARFNRAALLFVAKGVSCIKHDASDVPKKGQKSAKERRENAMLAQQHVSPAVNEANQTRYTIAYQLLDWRKGQLEVEGAPLATASVGNVFSSQEIKEIWNDINTTVKPAWFTSVPTTATSGKLKAEQWRALGLTYMPASLLRLWGDSDGSDYKRKLLHMTMCLVSALHVAVSRVTSDNHANAYLLYMSEYRRFLQELFPTFHCHPNHHMAMHLPEFLRMYGPVHGWWTFPYERVIGMLERIPTNYKEGEYEATIRRSFTQANNLRTIQYKIQCPQAIQYSFEIFQKLITTQTQDTLSYDLHDPSELDLGTDDVLDAIMGYQGTRKKHKFPDHLKAAFRATGKSAPSQIYMPSNFKIRGVGYSTHREHEGNSCVLLSMQGYDRPIPVCIEDFVINVEQPLETYIVFRRLLPATTHKDFSASYPIFRMQLLRNTLSSEVEIVDSATFGNPPHFAKTIIAAAGEELAGVISLSKTLRFQVVNGEARVQ